MSETQTTTTATLPEQRRAPQVERDTEERLKRALPPELYALINANISARHVGEFDNLNIKFNDQKNEAEKRIFNETYSNEYKAVYDKLAAAAGDTRSVALEFALAQQASTEASANARAKAVHESNNEVYAAMDDKFEDLTGEIMPDVDLSVMTEDEQRQYLAEYDSVKDAIMHIAAMDPNEWAGEQNPDGSLKHNGVMGTLNNELVGLPAAESHAEQATAPEAVTLRELSPEMQEAREELNELRDKKRKASVRLQNTPFWRYKERKEAREEYEKTLADYAERFKQHQIELAHFYGVATDDAERDAAYREAIGDELVRLTNEYVQADIQTEKAMLIEAGGKWAKLAERYNKLSTPKKILGGLAIGAAFGAVAVFTGGIGAGAAVGAVAATGVVTGRATRGYAMAMSQLYAPNPANIEPFTGIVENRHDHSLPDVAADYLIGQSNKEIKETTKIRLKAVTIAIGTVAAGTLLPVLADHAGDIKDFVSDRVFGRVGAANMAVEGAGNQGKAVAEAAAEAAKDVGAKAEISAIKDMLPDTPAAEKLMNNPNFYSNGEFNIPIESGDGFDRLGARYGLSDAQKERMMEIAAKQKGETYKVGNDLRLNLGDRKLSFTPSEMKSILAAK